MPVNDVSFSRFVKNTRRAISTP